MKSNSVIMMIFVILLLSPALKAENVIFYDDDIIQDGDIYPWPDPVHVYDTPPDTTTIQMTGGSIDTIFMHDTSTLNVSDGYIAWVNGQDSSTIEIIGGDISRLYANDSSIFNIHGGRFGWLDSAFDTLLTANISGVFNIFGYGFTYTPAEVGEGSFLLKGFWRNGDPFRVGLTDRVYSNHVILHEVPEPCTLSLLALGGLLLRRKK